MVEGERRPRRPARRLIDDILKCTCGKDLRDAASMTEDRTKWRQSVTSLYTVHADHATRRGRRRTRSKTQQTSDADSLRETPVVSFVLIMFDFCHFV